jgi:eukaryotic-like serine/threonine-protein kinase
MKSFFRYAILTLTLIVVTLVSALTAMRFAIHGQEVIVPAFVGVTPAEANRLATNLGLQLEIERQYYSPQIPEGRIMTQIPTPGAKVRRGWQVRVAESMGPQRVAIPDVINQSEHAAEWNIRRRGLDLASTAEMQVSGLPADQVVAQSPPPNANSVAAPKTNLLISVPADPATYVMPSFIGQPLGTASRTLQDAGFKLGNVTIAPQPQDPSAPPQIPSTPITPAQPSPASLIVVQNPPAGQKIIAGAIISFEVHQ